MSADLFGSWGLFAGQSALHPRPDLFDHDVIPQADLTVWLRPEELAALSNGASVTEWPAAPGTTLAATKESTNAPVIATAGAVNGYNPVQFTNATANGQRLEVNATSAVAGQSAGTLMVVFTRTSGTGSAVQASSQSTASSTASHWPFSGTTVYDRNLRSSRVTVGAVSDFTTGPNLVTVSSSSTDGWRWKWQGTQYATTTHAWPTMNEFALGGWVANGNYELNGYYYELIYWSRVLTAIEQTQVHAYLNDKYLMSLPTS